MIFFIGEEDSYLQFLMIRQRRKAANLHFL